MRAIARICPPPPAPSTSCRVAQRLMSIGSNSALSNATNSSHLPKALDAIYELSRMDPSDIEHGIESGAMHARVSGTW